MHHPDQLVGTTLGGKYRLDALLGAGAYGAVYRGWHLPLDLAVAVKVAFRVEGSFGKRFKREARTLMKLHHPHIVRVYDYDHDESGLVYLVQEFVSGQTLKGVLVEHGPLPPMLVARIGAQILGALGAAHAVGIIHRDVKLDNVMLAGPLDPPSIRLLDFGVAKLKQRDGDASELTQTGGILGTPAYMAPEQIHGEPVKASDLYAVGVVMHYLLTGERPFPYGVPRVYIAHLQDPPPPLPPSVPPALARVIERALAKSTDERYATADEMAAELWTMLGTMPPASASSGPMLIAAPTPSVGPGGSPTISEHPAELSVSDLLDATHTSTETRGAVIEVEATPSDTQRRSGWLVAGSAVAVVLAAALMLPFGEQPLTADVDARVLAGLDAAADAAPSPDMAPPPDVGLPDGRPVDTSAPDAARLDAAPPAPTPDAAPRPAERPSRKARRRRAGPPPPPPPPPVERALRDARAALGDCECEDAARHIAKVEALAPSRAAQIRSDYVRKCQVPGLPGSCK